MVAFLGRWDFFHSLFCVFLFWFSFYSSHIRGDFPMDLHMLLFMFLFMFLFFLGFSSIFLFVFCFPSFVFIVLLSFSSFLVAVPFHHSLVSIRALFWRILDAWSCLKYFSRPFWSYIFVSLANLIMGFWCTSFHLARLAIQTRVFMTPFYIYTLTHSISVPFV